MRMHRLLSGSLLSCLLGFATLSLSAAAQTTAPNEWTWMGGSNTIGSPGSADLTPGVYGTLGVPALGNIPGSRIGAAAWTDKSGNLWFYGGYGTGSVAFLLAPMQDDMWMFSPSTNEWTWMGGSNVGGDYSCGFSYVPAVYGTLGTPAPGNTPGGRYQVLSWTDSNGNFWLFGGVPDDCSSADDLWQFSPASNEWAWMGGSRTSGLPGVYGTLENPAPGNIPGGRDGSATWTDTSGNLWLFGGEGYDSVGNFGDLNDLWELDLSANQWTWMGGSSIVPTVNYYGTGGLPGVYGTLGEPSAGNIPGGRIEAVTWVDGAGNFWLFGGYGYDSNRSWGYLNDLWKFNTGSLEWAWMSGSSTVVCEPSGWCEGHPGMYGILGTAASANIPGGRYGAVSWTDMTGNLWLFGGFGNDSATGSGDLNDLWVYSPPANEWAWMGGNNVIGNSGGQSGVYGTLGVPATGNVPRGRDVGVSWTNSSGNFWLFGGENPAEGVEGAEFNDFWEYQPPPTTTMPSITPEAGTYNTIQLVTISDTTPNAIIYYTTDGLTTPTAASTQYAGAISVSSTETIQAVAVAANHLNSAVASATYTIDLPPAATPTFAPAAGTYTSAQSVAIADTTPNATIYYTTDGVTTPTINSTQYTGPIPVSATETIQAIAVASGFSTSAVASATYTIPPDFTVAINPTSISVQAGESGTATVTVTDEFGFNSNVSFACSGLPQGAACAFTLETVPTPAGISYSTLTVTTSASTASLHRNSNPLLPGSALAVALCCLGWKKRRRLLLLVLLAVSVAGLSLLNGCGSGGSGSGGSGGGGTQPVTSTVTVTATSGKLSHKATFTLTVN